MRILVTGAGGQLGSEIQELAKKKGLEKRIFFTDREELDICDVARVQSFCKDQEIEALINCAAYTAVDKAESEKELAEKINHLAVRNLAKVCKEEAIKLIHISTDYVFDGKNYRPYVEEDSTNPQGAYGKSKLAGEREILQIAPKGALILRTSWVYSSYGANFLKTILRLGEERESLGVIFDQVGTPTYARDLAEAIVEILLREDSTKLGEGVEIYHYSNEGVCSWYDFAREIMESAKIDCHIKAIESSQYPTPAKRPHYSVLNKSKIKKDFDLTIPYWKDSLRECIKKIKEEN